MSSATGTTRRTRVLWIAALLLLSSGCGRPAGEPAAEQSAPPQRSRSQVERGPLRVTAAVQPAKAHLSDEPKLTLTIDYEPGVAVEKPPFGESLGSFVIRDFHEPMAKVRQGREVIEQIYTLEPMDTGKLMIDPISVAFTDKRGNGDGKRHTVETEAIVVEVESVVPSAVPSLKELHAAAGPVALPYRGTWPLWLCGGILLAAAVAGAIWRRRARRSKALEAMVLSHEQVAYLALDRLVESRLAEADVKAFFVALTAIVRRYIEQTTGIRAPEETTEEFLREIGRSQRFSAEEKLRLRNFLESADLVKFAAHQPRREDIEESVQRARLFIGCVKPAADGGAREAAA